VKTAITSAKKEEEEEGEGGSGERKGEEGDEGEESLDELKAQVAEAQKLTGSKPLKLSSAGIYVQCIQGA
jgi:hypothetical protein